MFHVFKFCPCHFVFFFFFFNFVVIYFIPGLQWSEISKFFMYFTFNAVVFMLLHWWHCCSQLLCSLSEPDLLTRCSDGLPAVWMGNRDLIHGRGRHVVLQNQDSYWCQQAWCPVDITVFKAGFKQPGCVTNWQLYVILRLKCMDTLSWHGG